MNEPEQFFTKPEPVTVFSPVLYWEIGQTEQVVNGVKFLRIKNEDYYVSQTPLNNYSYLLEPECRIIRFPDGSVSMYLKDEEEDFNDAFVTKDQILETLNA